MADEMNDVQQDEVSPELDSMVCDLLDGYLNALADGEDLGVVLIAEDARANRYQACFTEDGPRRAWRVPSILSSRTRRASSPITLARSIATPSPTQVVWSSTASSKMPSS